MGFASAYLEKRALFPRLIKEAPVSGTEIIIVVPSFNEPGITDLLDSLASCFRPACEAEVIVIINAPPGATAESIENNRKSFAAIDLWSKSITNCFFRLFAVDVTHASAKGWGVGCARKTGMDEAVRRFETLNNPSGVIMNLDADCKVSKNYFTAIFNEFCTKKERKACSVYFEHPLPGDESREEILRPIVLYELHLRYFLQGLIYAGFPTAFHTVGSVMGVKALQYVRSGGMNRKLAGEDFYFIQKLIPMGGYFNLADTVVYPSSRLSSRVPFGTGKIVGRLAEENNCNLLTYNIQSFAELKYLFGMTQKIYSCPAEEVKKLYPVLPEAIKLFLDEKDWTEKIREIKENTSGYQTFGKRFFNWFNMFRIVKYMNSAHSAFFEKCPVEVSALKLLELRGMKYCTADPEKLLLVYRKLEKHTE